MSDFRTPSAFRQRLGYYVTGLAIGFLMLGVMWYIKAQAKAHQDAARQATPAQPPAPTPVPALPQ